jgi:hypothetical protein
MSDQKTSKAVHCVVDYPLPPKAQQFMKPVAMIADATGDVPERRDEERNAAPKLSEEHAMLGEAGVNSSKSDSKVVTNEPQ